MLLAAAGNVFATILVEPIDSQNARQRLEGGSHEEKFLGLLRRQVEDGTPPVGVIDDQTLTLQQAQGFPNDTVADAEALGQFQFPEPLTELIITRENGISDVAGDLGAQRFTAKRWRDAGILHEETLPAGDPLVGSDELALRN